MRRSFLALGLVLATSLADRAAATDALLRPAPVRPVSERPVPGVGPLAGLGGAPGGGLTVDRHSRAAVVQFWKQHFEPAFLQPVGWTGNVAGCVPGATSTAYAGSTLQIVNWFRAMAGLSGDVALNPAHDLEEQSAALVMIANGSLSHAPPQSWACWSQSAFDGAYNSNIALGVAGPEAVVGYIEDDGAGNEEVGHRRWILYGPQQSMGTGSTDGVFQVGPFYSYVGSNALWVFDDWAQPPPTPLVVTWPPSGFLPYEVLFPRFSVSIAGADFRQATVSVTRGGSPLGITVHPQSPDPGSGYWLGDETLVFELAPSDVTFSPGMPDTTFHVALDGILPLGATPVPSSVSYDVTVIDPDLSDADGDGHPDTRDNCPYAANLDQADRGGIGSTSTADGIGDACQCGDVSGDGKVTLADAVLIQRSQLNPPTATLVRPELCDVGGSTGCSNGDAVIVRRRLLSPPTAQIQANCAPAKP